MVFRNIVKGIIKCLLGSYKLIFKRFLRHDFTEAKYFLKYFLKDCKVSVT